MGLVTRPLLTGGYNPRPSLENRGPAAPGVYNTLPRVLQGELGGLAPKEEEPTPLHQRPLEGEPHTHTLKGSSHLPKTDSIYRKVTNRKSKP